MAGDDRHYQRYFDIFQWWMSPGELDAIRKEMGSAEDILERHERVEKLLKASSDREALWLFAKRAGVAFAALMGAVLTAKNVLPAGWWPW